MNYYYNIEFAKGQVDLYNTNANAINPVAAHFEKIVTWKLNKLPLTKKFIRLFIERQRWFRQHSIGWYLNYNYYLPRTRENIAIAKREMNETVEWIFANVPGITHLDRTMMLNQDDIDNIELDKLNALHFMFEQNLPWMEEQQRPFEQISHVEKVNSLVHFLEFGTQESNFMSCVFRPVMGHADIVPDIPLTREDYSSFEVNLAGTLQLDFATVGKDLIAAYTTNDQDLVRNKEVKPQQFCTTTVNIELGHDVNVMRPEQRRGIPPKVREWITENALEEYIDLTNPMYSIGRHPLGEPTDPAMYGHDFWLDIIRNCPYVNRVYISNDDGQVF